MNDRIKTELQAGRTASISGLTLLDLLDIQDSLGLGAGQLRIIADSRALVDREDTGEPWWVIRDEDGERHVAQAESAVMAIMHFDGFNASCVGGPYLTPPVLAPE